MSSSENWRDLFEKRRPAEGQAVRTDADDTAPGDEGEIAPPPDPKEYRPWILQRGGRPALFIDLRRFEPKTGALIGCQMSYPHLIAIDYIGDRMVSLDFGARQFVIEGTGLSELPGRLQQGLVLAIQEYSSTTWAACGTPKVTRIVMLGKEQ